MKLKSHTWYVHTFLTPRGWSGLQGCVRNIAVVYGKVCADVTHHLWEGWRGGEGVVNSDLFSYTKWEATPTTRFPLIQHTTVLNSLLEITRTHHPSLPPSSPSLSSSLCVGAWYYNMCGLKPTPQPIPTGKNILSHKQRWIMFRCTQQLDGSSSFWGCPRSVLNFDWFTALNFRLWYYTKETAPPSWAQTGWDSRYGQLFKERGISDHHPQRSHSTSHTHTTHFRLSIRKREMR